MRAALEKRKHGKAITIPVIVRPANWQNVPKLKDIQVLPRNGEPISTQDDQEHALWKVVKEIEGTIEAVGLEADETAPPPVPNLVSKDISPPNPPAAILIPFLKLIVTRRWGWAVIGAIVLLSGLLWGASSPTVPYIGTPEGYTPLNVIPTKSGDLYISAPENQSTFYIAHCNDLSPHVDCAKLPSKMKLGFFARPEPISMNGKIRDDITGRDLQVSQAYVIEELDVSDLSNGSRKTYTASDFSPNHMYYENRWWPVAIALIGSGLLVAYVALFVRRRRRQGHSSVP
jgi:hypothetical protein